MTLALKITRPDHTGAPVTMSETALVSDCYYHAWLTLLDFYVWEARMYDIALDDDVLQEFALRLDGDVFGPVLVQWFPWSFKTAYSAEEIDG